MSAVKVGALRPPAVWLLRTQHSADDRGGRARARSAGLAVPPPGRSARPGAGRGNPDDVQSQAGFGLPVPDGFVSALLPMDNMLIVGGYGSSRAPPRTTMVALSRSTLYQPLLNCCTASASRRRRWSGMAAGMHPSRRARTTRPRPAAHRRSATRACRRAAVGCDEAHRTQDREHLQAVRDRFGVRPCPRGREAGRPGRLDGCPANACRRDRRGRISVAVAQNWHNRSSTLIWPAG